MDISSGYIEVDIFPKEINSIDHQEVIHLREVLEELALDYECQLTDFDIHCGTVIFAFDSDELMANIIEILENDT